MSRCVIAAVLLLAGCADRRETDAAIARLSVLRAEQDIESFHDSTGGYITECARDRTAAFQARVAYEEPPLCALQDSLYGNLGRARRNLQRLQ